MFKVLITILSMTFKKKDTAQATIEAIKCYKSLVEDFMNSDIQDWEKEAVIDIFQSISHEEIKESPSQGLPVRMDKALCSRYMKEYSMDSWLTHCLHHTRFYLLFLDRKEIESVIIALWVMKESIDQVLGARFAKVMTGCQDQVLEIMQLHRIATNDPALSLEH